MNIKLNCTAFNILRVYATLMVFFSHSYFIGYEEFGFHLHGLFYLFNTPAWGAVWMFFAMGGFLAAYGFDKNSYNTERSGIIRYYKTRFVKILLPTWLFIIMAFIFDMKESSISLRTFLQFITCTFNGQGAGIKAIGASWYVFVSMWFYLFAPFLYIWLLKYEKKHKGKELKSYLLLFLILSVVSITYKVGIFLLGLDYYTWIYTNVFGSIDLFIIGMIGCRFLHYLPTNVSRLKIRRLKIMILILLVLLTTIFSGLMNEFGIVIPILYIIQTILNLIVYKYIGPHLFAATAISFILIFSYRCNESILNNNQAIYLFGKICNTISTYTFMFYLWHCILLVKVANKLIVTNVDIHYISMLAIGFITTVFIAYLTTNMNNGIIKQILKR